MFLWVLPQPSSFNHNENGVWWDIVPNTASTAFVGLWTVMIEYSSVLDNLLQLADVAVYLLLLHLIVLQVALEILLVGIHVDESVA